MKENAEEEKPNDIRSRIQNLSNLKEINQEETDLENLDNQEVKSRSSEPNQFYEAIDTLKHLRPQAEAFRPGKTCLLVSRTEMTQAELQFRILKNNLRQKRKK